MSDKKTTRELVLILLERSESHLRELEDQSKHLEKINGTNSQNIKDIASVKTSTRNQWWVLGAVGPALLFIIGAILQLVRTVGG